MTSLEARAIRQAHIRWLKQIKEKIRDQQQNLASAEA
tara:strand:+ start:119 stop:229 length:111 start_codon:yes stop_codon:yes gene_type:complete